MTRLENPLILIDFDNFSCFFKISNDSSLANNYEMTRLENPLILIDFDNFSCFFKISNDTSLAMSLSGNIPPKLCDILSHRPTSCSFAKS